MRKIKLAIIFFVSAIISSCSITYDPEINTAFVESVELFNECVDAINQTSTARANANVNDISRIKDELEYKGVYERIDSLQSDLKSRITYSLANPPKNRRDCFNDLVDLIGLVNQYAQYATEPSVLYTYDIETSRLNEEINSEIDKMQIKYPNIITSRFSRTKD